MKIKVMETIKQFNGEEIKGENEKAITWRDVIGVTINMMKPNEPLTAEQKQRAFQIGLKLYGKGEVEFTTDQLAFIKERISLFQPPVIYGRFLQLIGDADEEGEKVGKSKGKKEEAKE